LSKIICCQYWRQLGSTAKHTVILKIRGYFVFGNGHAPRPQGAPCSVVAEQPVPGERSAWTAHLDRSRRPRYSLSVNGASEEHTVSSNFLRFKFAAVPVHEQKFKTSSGTSGASGAFSESSRPHAFYAAYDWCATKTDRNGRAFVSTFALEKSVDFPLQKLPCCIPFCIFSHDFKIWEAVHRILKTAEANYIRVADAHQWLSCCSQPPTMPQEHYDSSQSRNHGHEGVTIRGHRRTW
jgi:hypothetical protein